MRTLGLLLSCVAIAAPISPTVARAEKPACPPGMVRIAVGARTVCIDLYEASLDGKRAVVRKGVVPAHNVSHDEAAAACAASHRRLCTLEEWTAACGGRKADGASGPARQYPYGDRYEPRRCNDLAGGAGKPLPSGARPKCVTPEGVADLSGNLWEWVSDLGPDGKTARLVGGGFPNDQSDDMLACVPEDPIAQPVDAKNPTLGFRCCK